MNNESLKGKTFGRGSDGKPLVGYCRVCGKLTLDTDTLLCDFCYLNLFLKKFSTPVSNSLQERKEVEK